MEMEMDNGKDAKVKKSLKGKADHKNDNDHATPGKTHYSDSFNLLTYQNLAQKTIPQIIRAEWNGFTPAERKTISSKMLEEQNKTEYARIESLLITPKERVKFIGEEVDSLTHQVFPSP